MVGEAVQIKFFADGRVFRSFLAVFLQYPFQRRAVAEPVLPSLGRNAIQTGHGINFNRPRTRVGFQFAFGCGLLIAPMLCARRYTQASPSRKCPVIPAGMQESRAMEGNSTLCKCLIQDAHQPADSPPCDWIPAVHAGMTGLQHLCITMSAERGNDQKCKFVGRKEMGFHDYSIFTFHPFRFNFH